MNFTYLKKKLLWFTLIFFIVLVIVGYLICGCFPWLLMLTLYVFFTMYILLSYGGKMILDELKFNPFTYLFVSFFSKVIFVIGFAWFLTEYFTLPRKTILLMLVFAYLVAATFDFILISSSNKQPVHEGKSQ